MRWFDAGVNLLDARLDPDAVIRASVEAGVDKLCVITTQPKEWALAAKLCRQFPEHLCFTVGIHPHCAKLATDHDLSQLKHFIRQPGAVAIGECGLDFNRNFSPPDVQVAVFKAQLAIAVEMNMPVYLHERDAFDTQMECLMPVADKLVGGIAHCFTSDAESMHAYVDVGLDIGVTGWICDPQRGEALREAVLSLPLERLVLETDAPYLYPKTRKPRQRHNQPACLPFIGQQISELTGIPPAIISQRSYANTLRLFQLA
ncbi:TatD family hydrolase [Alteromonas pelagimontana]|uniref:TatD family hydrolase n=1 Tax=Alteromonas pelagimontana TaxID=1858656 RepID=A0A6M4MCG0_9ALTE|nr:TatD family hydrolase [Alteromonas pelagimontana]QJR80508.1 TatD family hydrolase [Alteromonas pelagimontana]